MLIFPYTHTDPIMNSVLYRNQIGSLTFLRSQAASFLQRVLVRFCSVCFSELDFLRCDQEKHHETSSPTAFPSSILILCLSPMITRFIVLHHFSRNCLICHLDFDLLIKHFFMVFECVFQEGPPYLPVGVITFWKSSLNFVFHLFFFTMLLWGYQKLHDHLYAGYLQFYCSPPDIFPE